MNKYQHLVGGMFVSFNPDKKRIGHVMVLAEAPPNDFPKITIFFSASVTLSRIQSSPV